LLVTPQHTLDRINLINKDGVLHASNSLAFLLQQADETLDQSFLFYDSYMASIREGVRRYRRRLPTACNVDVQIVYYSNILIDSNLSFTSIPKTRSPEFLSFQAYRDYLKQTIDSVTANAVNSERRISYKPKATVSRGYDSPAVLALATEITEVEALSFSTSRGSIGDEDCGKIIAELLGVPVRLFDRLGYRDRVDFPEIENAMRLWRREFLIKDFNE